MKAHDKDSFEGAWGAAFNDAESTPSPQVWDKVALGIATKANSGYKKRILFFKLMAAASVLFAAIIGGVSFYNSFENNRFTSEQMAVSNESTRIADNNINQSIVGGQPSNEMGTQSNASNEKPNNVSRGLKNTDTEGDNPTKPSHKQSINNNPRINQSESNGNVNGNLQKSSRAAEEIKSKNVTTNTKNIGGQNRKEKLGSIINEKKEYSNSFAFNTKQGKSNFDTKEDVALLEKIKPETMAFGSLLEREMQLIPRLYISSKDSDKNYNNLWVGMDVATGQNNPTARGGTAESLSNLASFEDSNFSEKPIVSNEQSGSVFSTGVSIGKRISKRWVLETGVNYIERLTLVKSNLVITDSDGLNAYSSAERLKSNESLSLTNSYKIENTYYSISIPFQAGYVLIDRRFDVMIQGGLANEILLGNRVKDVSGNLSETTIQTGSDSPYNTYIISGVVGTSLSYLIADKYHIALVPEVRKSLNSITKTSSSIESRPISFTLGLSFKYVFD